MIQQFPVRLRVEAIRESDNATSKAGEAGRCRRRAHHCHQPSPSPPQPRKSS